MQASLLSHDERAKSDFSSLTVDDKNSFTTTDASAPASTSSSIFKRQKAISAFALYSLIAFAGLMTVLSIVFLVSWMSARATSPPAVVPPFSTGQQCQH
jgi:hypothetical protein